MKYRYPLTISNIDKRVPTGRLIYGQPENGKVKVYVEHDADSWIEEPQNVQTDAEGEYIEFTSNGMIQITLKNDVGNITTLIAEVYVLDTEPPVITSSRWLTQTGDLTKVTNGAVRLYMDLMSRFPEQSLPYQTAKIIRWVMLRRMPMRKQPCLAIR